MPTLSRPLQPSSAANSVVRCNTAEPDVFGPPVSPRRPSEGWLRSPAWIGLFLEVLFPEKISSFENTDGGINPPHFYYSHEEIEAARSRYGPPAPIRGDAVQSYEPHIDPALSRPDPALSRADPTLSHADRTLSCSDSTLSSPGLSHSDPSVSCPAPSVPLVPPTVGSDVAFGMFFLRVFLAL